MVRNRRAAGALCVWQLNVQSAILAADIIWLSFELRGVPTTAYVFKKERWAECEAVSQRIGLEPVLVGIVEHCTKELDCQGIQLAQGL